MSEEIINLLPSARYMIADNSDQSITINFDNTSKILNDQNITEYLDIAEQFDNERQSSEKYRIYGNFNYMSLIRDLNGYTINSISELFIPKNSGGKDYNFDNFFDIQIVYPSNFVFNKKIDDNLNLYDVKYTIIGNISYQQIRSAYQQNCFSEYITNLVSNNNIDLSSLVTNVSDYNINIPINSVSFYITLKDKTRITTKQLKSSYDLNNLFIHTATTYGYDDSKYDFKIYNSTFDLAILSLKDINSTYKNVEYINKVRDNILLLFKMENIEIIPENIILNSKYIKKYLDLERDITDIDYIPYNTNIIDGGHIIFNHNNFTWEHGERLEHKFHIEYNYRYENKEPIYDLLQPTKEIFNYLNDYAVLNGETFSITKKTFDTNNKTLEVDFKVSNLSKFERYNSTYKDNLNNVPNPVRFNNFNVDITNNKIKANKKTTIDLKQKNNNTTDKLYIYFKYSPFIDIKIKEFTSTLQTSENSNNISIPDYNIFENNLYIWRDLLDKGFIEPDTGVGLDYPFLNGNTYIDNNLRFYVGIDKTDIFSNILFNNFQTNISIDYYKFNNNSNNKCDFESWSILNLGI